MVDVSVIAENIYHHDYKTISRYVDILANRGIEWGLLGPREVPRLWERHILNSAAVSLAIPAGVSVVDIGSGAGLPGIPIAVLRRDLSVTLLEPLQRRAHFLELAVDELGLSDTVTVVRGRAEEHEQTYDVATARAVTALGNLAALTLPLLKPSGQLIALKGQKVFEEIDAARKFFTKKKLEVDVRTVQLHPELETATLAVVSAMRASR